MPVSPRLFRLAVLFVVALLSWPGLCQQTVKSAALRGTVRDSQGKAIADAALQLRSKDAAQNPQSHSDAQGNYAFVGLQPGVYTLRVVMNGYADAEIPSLFLAPKEVRKVDLTLNPAKISGAPQFFDQPQFTVAGVTDTSNLGGHGSDTIVRTRETLAKETVSLGKSSANKAGGLGAEEESLRLSVQREPSSFDANHRLGRLLVQSGKAAEAVSYLERAAQVRPADYDNAYDLALAYADAGDYDQAREHVRSLLQSHDTAELHHLSGDVDEKLGDSLEAVRQYQRAAQMDPSEPYLFDWASELLLHHAPEPAIAVFTTGNRLFPGSTRMLMGLGAAWFTRGSYDEAVRRVCRASDLNPDEAAPYVFLGKMQQAENVSSADVVEKLHRFVTRQPQNAQANYYYAVALGKLRKSPQDKERNTEVEGLLKNAIRLDPRLAAAELQLGILQSQQADYAAAVASYQRAIQIDPQMEEAHYRLAQAYRRLGQQERARQELRLYQQLANETAQRVERERREIRQFVYTLRDQPSAQVP